MLRTQLSIVAIASAANWSATLFYIVSAAGLCLFLVIALPVLAPPRRVAEPRYGRVPLRVAESTSFLLVGVVVAGGIVSVLIQLLR